MYVCGYDVYIVYMFVLVEMFVEMKDSFIGKVVVIY